MAIRQGLWRISKSSHIMRLFIYLELSGYLREWLIHTMGTPVEFPPHSVENAILARNIGRIPHGKRTELYRIDAVPIVVPTIRYKSPTEWNYLGRRGRVELTDAIDNLFCIDMWQCLSPQLGSGNITRCIDEWCCKRGITMDNVEAVRQRFYRLRNNYSRYNIILGKKYKKNLQKINDDSGKK